MKTICIYHSRDLDGFMSAAIVKYWFEKQKEDYYNSKVFKEVDVNFGTLDFLGWDYGDDIPDLSGHDKVIMVDISFPDIRFIVENGIELIWIDHHISGINHSEPYAKLKGVEGIRNTHFSACELTWMYFNYHSASPTQDMPEIVRLLGRWDNNTDKQLYEKYNKPKQIIEFQYGARAVIKNYEDAYNYLIQSINWLKENSDPYSDSSPPEEDILMDGKAIYGYLQTEAKQIYSKAFPITFQVPVPQSDTGLNVNNAAPYRANFLCVNRERFNPFHFDIDYHKDGYEGFACFWFDGPKNKWTFSLYNDNDQIDCSRIAKQYGGGGSKEAAGFVIDNLQTFLKK